VFPPPSQSHLGDLGGTTRPSTAPPAPQVRPISPIKSHGACPEDSRNPRPHRPLLVNPPSLQPCFQSQSHQPPRIFLFSPISLQPSRCSTPPVFIESSTPPLPTSKTLPKEQDGRPTGPHRHLLAKAASNPQSPHRMTVNGCGIGPQCRVVVGWCRA